MESYLSLSVDYGSNHERRFRSESNVEACSHDYVEFESPISDTLLRCMSCLTSRDSHSDRRDLHTF